MIFTDELEKLMLYLHTTDDATLEVLLQNAQQYAVDYCNLAEYQDALNPVVFRMVCEDWNRKGSEGVASAAYAGLSETSAQDYSPQVMRQLRKHRRLKTI
ncbi:phage head-tail connector protein [Butyricicoccus sp.]|uniref:phage head-tail connector protein n=1 Tax=Butyricicoccus sp. TaxID=2049021 RepID=UPI003F138E17